MSSVRQPAIVCGRLAVLAVSAGFRPERHDALTARRDELFELADAVLCTDGCSTFGGSFSTVATDA